jgi:hypothetical protein
MKIIFITFFYIKGAFHFKFIPQDHLGNQVYCMDMMKRLIEAVHRKGLELRPNASAHKALCVKQFLNQKSTTDRTPTLYPWIDFQWLMTVSKNKIYFEGEKI